MDQDHLLPPSSHMLGVSKGNRLVGLVNETMMEHDNYPSVIYEEDPIDMIEYHQTDQSMPNLIFKPKLGSSSTWEDEEHDGYSSLPFEIDQVNHVDSMYLDKLENAQKEQPWEAEDVGDFITTLDESQILDIESMESICVAVAAPPRRIKMRPKSLYEPSTQPFTFTTAPTCNLSDSQSQLSNQIMVTSGGPVEKCPKIMTTSCYGTLISDQSRIGSDSNLVLKTHDELNKPFPSSSNGQLLLENSLLWMASTEELIKMNNNISSIIQQKSLADSQSATTNETLLLSLENSFCESVNNISSSRSTMAITDVAESGECTQTFHHRSSSVVAARSTTTSWP